jgi:hypothetical protein
LGGPGGTKKRLLWVIFDLDFQPLSRKLKKTADGTARFCVFH